MNLWIRFATYRVLGCICKSMSVLFSILIRKTWTVKLMEKERWRRKEGQSGGIWSRCEKMNIKTSSHCNHLLLKTLFYNQSNHHTENFACCEIFLSLSCIYCLKGWGWLGTHIYMTAIFKISISVWPHLL
jgi:hypothetical protein